MLESLRPFTWFVGALAAWSVGLLLLAVAGLGGRVGPHPGNPALAPAIPALQFSESAQRLGPASDYLAVGERPLFLPDRRPAPVAMASAEPKAPFDGVLTSVLLTDTLRMAIFNEPNRPPGTRVRLGDAIPGTAWRLVSLEPRRAVLEGPEGQRTLDLRVFDGQNGEAPTPVSFVPPAPSGTASPPGASAAVPGSPANPNPPTLVQQASQANPNPPTLVQQASQANAEAQRSAADQAQIEAIRARIEARRAQLREQQERNNNAPVAKQ